MTHNMIALLFSAPFVIVSFAISAWWLCCYAINEDTKDPYDNPDNWGV